MSYLIKDTTREEREKIVADSLGYIEANCDGCMTGLVEMYQDYIDGKKELRDIILICTHISVVRSLYVNPFLVSRILKIHVFLTSYQA